MEQNSPYIQMHASQPRTWADYHPNLYTSHGPSSLHSFPNLSQMDQQPPISPVHVTYNEIQPSVPEHRELGHFALDDFVILDTTGIIEKMKLLHTTSPKIESLRADQFIHGVIF